MFWDRFLHNYWQKQYPRLQSMFMIAKKGWTKESLRFSTDFPFILHAMRFHGSKITMLLTEPNVWLQVLFWSKPRTLFWNRLAAQTVSWFVCSQKRKAWTFRILALIRKVARIEDSSLWKRYVMRAKILTVAKTWKKHCPTQCQYDEWLGHGELPVQDPNSRLLVYG